MIMDKLMKSIIKIVCVLAFVVLLLFVGNVIVIANQIQTATNVYCAYAFYVVLLALLIIFIIKPVIKLLRMPSLISLSKVNEGYPTSEIRKIANNLAQNYQAETDEEKDAKRKFIEGVKECGTVSRNELIEKYVNPEIERRMSKIKGKIEQYRNRVFVLTAISQSNRFDAVSVWILNFRMINDLIKQTGFRPSYYQMFQIYWRVLATGAFAYAVSDVTDWADETFFSDISQEIGEKIGSAIFGKILGIFTKSLADGAVNALFTWRLGYVTKKYLEIGFDKFKDRRMDIYKESIIECRNYVELIRKAS